MVIVVPVNQSPVCNTFLLEMANSYYETLWKNAAELGEDHLNQIVPTWNPKT